MPTPCRVLSDPPMAFGSHEARCLLCCAPMHAIGAVIVMGNVADPDVDEICCTCAALSLLERKRLRNAAMVQMLRAEGSSRATRGSEE